MTSKLPSDYQNERSALDREILKQQPGDILQFCANFFQRRLESQRAEFLLSQRHSSGAGVAESNFPGSNPFGTTSSSTSPAAALGPGGMHSVAEEEEHDFASPTASSFPPNVRDPSASPSSSAAMNNDASAGNSTFGNFGFASATGSRSNPPSSVTAGAMEQPQSFPSNYNMNRRTSVSAESLAPAAADDNSWKAPSYPKTQEQVSRLRAAVVSQEHPERSAGLWQWSSI